MSNGERMMLMAANCFFFLVFKRETTKNSCFITTGTLLEGDYSMCAGSPLLGLKLNSMRHSRQVVLPELRLLSPQLCVSLLISYTTVYVFTQT